jgi:hypothetical protein
MKVNKKTLLLVMLFCLILVIGIQLIAVAIEVPLSLHYSNSNTDWWQYQFEDYENDPDHAFNKNVNCGPACSAMLINYLRGKGITTTYYSSISSAYPEVHCYARWDYCKANGHSNGYDNSDWSSPGATTEQIISALSSENIQTHTFTGYDCCSDGRGITNLQNAIDQGKVCICLVDPSRYRDTDCHRHWVVAYGYDSNYIYLNDPGYITGEGFPASKSDFADALWDVTGLSTVIVSDTTIYNYPTVDSFSVTPTSITLGDSFNFSYTVSDDIGLQQTELWRVNDVGGEPGDWDASYNPIFTKVLSGQKNYSGSFTDTPDTPGTYWYGMHVVDTSGNWSVEPKPPGPIVVTVTNPTPTIDISLEEVEICKMSSYNPNTSNVSVNVKFKNIGEVVIDSFQIELYINGEQKHVEKEDNKNLDPGDSGNSIFYWTLSEDVCGDNMKMEIKITDVNPVESNVNTENNSKTKNLSIYYVTFNIKEETYSFKNPGFNDWPKLKSTLDELEPLIKGVCFWALGKILSLKGVCYGMASTVIAYKEGSLAIPYGGTVNDLELTITEVSNNILVYQTNLSALGLQIRRINNQIEGNFPYISDEYQKIVNSLKEGKLIMLTLGESGTFKAHQLVVYQCIKDNNTNITYVYFYDPNESGYEWIGELYPETFFFYSFSYDNYDMLWAENLKSLPAELIEEYFNDLASLVYNGLRSAGRELINVFSSVNPFKNKNGFTEDTLITDEYGRKIGYLDGAPINEIPDGVIEIFGNFQTYQIPLSLNYDIQIKGKEQGVFELHLTKPNPDDTMLNLIYEDVPTENNSEASLTIGSSITDFTMHLDQDGDGIIDEIKDPDFIEGVILLIGDFGSANNGPPDCKVDFEDLMIFALAYGSTSSDYNWNLVCDIASEGGVLELDGVIDFEDLMVFAMHYGETCADL